MLSGERPAVGPIREFAPGGCQTTRGIKQYGVFWMAVCSIWNTLKSDRAKFKLGTENRGNKLCCINQRADWADCNGRRTIAANGEALGSVGPHAMKWRHHPNLRLRPHAPAKGRGRLQRQIARAFAVGGPVLSSSVIYDWCFARQRRVSQLRRHGAWRILMAECERVGRAETIGRPWLWRLRNSSE